MLLLIRVFITGKEILTGIGIGADPEVLLYLIWSFVLGTIAVAFKLWVGKAIEYSVPFCGSLEDKDTKQFQQWPSLWRF